jgi:hypothetical protein
MGLECDSFSVENIVHDFNHYAHYNVLILILEADLNSSLNLSNKLLCFDNLIFLIFFIQISLTIILHVYITLINNVYHIYYYVLQSSLNYCHGII